MKQYIGINIVEATPMKRGDYNIYRGWTIAEDENPDDEGYLVIYNDGYKAKSWISKSLFNQAHRECMGMTFGIALELLKKGVRVAREGWIGKGKIIVYQKGYPQGIPCNKQTAAAWGMQEGDLFVCRPYLQIRNGDGSHSMWVPSIGDCLADDWVIAE